jgi:hypothetical protein
MVLEGRVVLSHFDARRKPGNGSARIIDDAALTEMVRVAGIERVLTAASVVERELHQ